jgi:hypothetical protein
MPCPVLLLLKILLMRDALLMHTRTRKKLRVAASTHTICFLKPLQELITHMIILQPLQHMVVAASNAPRLLLLLPVLHLLLLPPMMHSAAFFFHALA